VGSPVEPVRIQDVFLRGEQRPAAVLEVGQAARQGQLHRWRSVQSREFELDAFCQNPNFSPLLPPYPSQIRSNRPPRTWKSNDCDGVSVGGVFFTICCKMRNRVRFGVPVEDALSAHEPDPRMQERVRGEA
jgi:hypothetical protein